MRTTLRKVGNSQGVLIPSALLAECQLRGAVEMTVEAGRLVISPVRELREGWFSGYQAEADEDAWEGLAVDADCGEWEW
jgi:antitoxin MazE